MKTIIERLIKEGISQEEDYIREHNLISDILRPLDGKPINGRTLNDKRLNGLEFRSEYSMYYINGKYSHLIGYNTDPVVKADKFEDFDICHGSAAKERIEQLQNINVDLLVSVFSEIQEHFEKLRVLFGDIERKHIGSFYNPIYYDILRAIKPDKEPRHTDLRLSDFYYIRK